MLDQQNTTRTVVNKTDSIDNTFRFFKMELLAGEDNMVTTVHENGCTFTFDFSRVYWNSRLHTEHERVVGMLKKGDVVVDVFAGVGPFAIPAAKKGCTVYANDLNPQSYEALVENSRKNQVSHRLHAFNLDGRDFMREVIPKLVDSSLKSSSASTVAVAADVAPVICSHIIMNLPAMAVQFLDTLQGLFLSVPRDKRNTIKLPTVHCYCFSKSEDPDKDSREMVEKNLGKPLAEGSYSVLNVRQVSPNKVMMRVSFMLSPEVAFSEGSLAVDRPGKSCTRGRRTKDSQFLGMFEKWRWLACELSQTWEVHRRAAVGVGIQMFLKIQTLCCVEILKEGIIVPTV